MKNFKAHFWACGDEQIEKIDSFETYTPVIQWITVLLMFTLENVLGLKSNQDDVTAAFLCATLGDNKTVYVEMTLGAF